LLIRHSKYRAKLSKVHSSAILPTAQQLVRVESVAVLSEIFYTF